VMMHSSLPVSQKLLHHCSVMWWCMVIQQEPVSWMVQSSPVSFILFKSCSITLLIHCMYGLVLWKEFMVYVTVCLKNDENHLYAIFLEPHNFSFGEFFPIISAPLFCSSVSGLYMEHHN
jgi:hypothetical protein